MRERILQGKWQMEHGRCDNRSIICHLPSAICHPTSAMFRPWCFSGRSGLYRLRLEHAELDQHAGEVVVAPLVGNQPVAQLEETDPLDLHPPSRAGEAHEV